MNEYLLSDEAMTDAIRKHHLLHSDAVVYITDYDRAVAKAQAKHMLEQLEKERRIIHMPTDYMLYPLDKLHNADNCWLCAALREVA